MNVLAPEFSALIIILRSVGPVISTRRSIRSAGSDGPGVLSDPRVLLREVERLAAIDPRLAFHSPAQQVQAGGIESSMEVGDEFQRFRREDLGARALDRWANLHPLLC